MLQANSEPSLLGLPSCEPLQRQTFSAPARILLEGCLRRTASLHEQLDKITDQVRGRSGSEATNSCPIEDNLESIMVCHGCHGRIGDGAHIGSSTGKNICTLVHSCSCPGGIMEDASWRACPDGYVPGVSGFQQVGSMQADSLPQTSEEDLLRFQRQAQGEGVKEKRPAMVFVEPGSHQSTIHGGTSSVDTPVPHTLPPVVEEQVQLLRALNQQAQQAGKSDGDVLLSISEIRKITGMRELVDSHMNEFQEVIPALSAAKQIDKNEASSTAAMNEQQQSVPEQIDLDQSEAEYRDLLAQQEQVKEAIRVANLQQQKSQSLAQQVISRPQPEQPHAQMSNLAAASCGSLQRELQLQQREQQRLQEALVQMKIRLTQASFVELGLVLSLAKMNINVK